MSYKKHGLLILCSQLSSHPVFGGVRVAHLVSFLCLFVLFVFFLCFVFSVFSNNYSSLSQGVWVTVMVFNATFSNISAISWRSVLLVEETGVPGENHLYLLIAYT